MRNLIVFFIIAVSKSELVRFLAEYSRWSGLTTWVSLGNSQQQVRMAIDLSTSDSSIFNEKACPPFVTCFSGNTRTTPSLRTLLPGWKVPLNILYTKTESPVAKPSMKNRDVGGILGFGHYTSWLQQRTILLRRVTFEDTEKALVEFKEVEALEHRRNRAIAFFSPQTAAWDFQSNVLIANVAQFKALNMKIMFNHDGIILPGSSQELTIEVLSDALETDKIGIVAESKTKNRLVVPCKKLSQLQGISFSLSRGQSLYIDDNTLLFATSSDKSECFLRIIFDTSLGPRDGMIGRILLESVEEMFLSFPTGVLGFQLFSRGSELPPLLVNVVPRLLVPSFHLPEIDDNTIVFRNQLFDLNDGLVLQSWEPQSFHDSLNCWSFTRNLPDYTLDLNQSVHFEIAQNATLDGPSMSDGDILFNYANSTESRVVIYANANVVYICDKKMEQTASQSNPECPICLLTIHYNKIPCSVCKKPFHPACINTWKSKGHSSCPHCRQEFDPQPTNTAVSSCSIS